MLKDDLVTGAKGASDFTGLSARSIYHMVEKGQLPVIRRGARYYFRKSELEAAFSSRNL